MNLKTKQALIRKLRDYKGEGSTLRFKCPKCKDQDYDLMVNFQTNYFECFRGKCKWRGPLMKIFEYLNILSDCFSAEKVYQTIQRVSGNEIKSIDIQGFEELPLVGYNEYWDYLKGRGIPYERAKEMGVGISTSMRFRDRVIIPIKEDRQVVCFAARDITKTAKQKELFPDTSISSKSHYLYNLDEIRSGDIVIVVEGIFDSEAVRLAGFKCVAVCGSHLSDVQIGKLLSKYPTKIAIWFDNDSAGMLGNSDARSKLMKRFSGKTCSIKSEKDPKKYNSEEIQKMVKEILQ